MQYFVKNHKIHKYPVPPRCKVEYSGEKLYDESPFVYEECGDCFYIHPRSYRALKGARFSNCGGARLSDDEYIDALSTVIEFEMQKVGKIRGMKISKNIITRYVGLLREFQDKILDEYTSPDKLLYSSRLLANIAIDSEIRGIKKSASKLFREMRHEFCCIYLVCC